ncbi:phosphoribosylformylglycinamidine synthase subunit PurQ [Stomatohabitans albus]|uniref:phosphoribosylformylglycinamidine synthase subunit PurQ n=1 Tax=Stomatohabitans albus TaxID=3110766 RepID=UPI00300D6441
MGTASHKAELPISPVNLRIGVITFPGTCDDRDAAYAVELLGCEAVPLWYQDTDLKGVDGVIVPGGFSFGDYLRCGAISRFAPIMDALRDFADNGGRVLGICNGFQILTEAGLLPGALTRNVNMHFRHRIVHLKNAQGKVHAIWLKSGEGRYIHPDIEALDAAGQVWLRYVNPDGSAAREGDDANPNGAMGAIAGVKNAQGNVAGLMPHPEHSVDPALGGLVDGRDLILEHLVTPRLGTEDWVNGLLAAKE